jgi:hypothetical protein
MFQGHLKALRTSEMVLDNTKNFEVRTSYYSLSYNNLRGCLNSKCAVNCLSGLFPITYLLITSACIPTVAT